MLFKFGDIEFTAANLPPDKLTVDSEYRWVQSDVLKREPRQQWVGEGASTFSLSGVMFPGLKVANGQQGQGGIKKVQDVARKGEPALLVDGIGNIYGRVCLTKLSEERSNFHTNGAPREITFTLNFIAYGEDTSGIGGGVDSLGGGGAFA